jgi:NADH-quinone oxidoreductase subunit L
MIFRVFFGDPSPEAVELEGGHLHHADVPRNPVTGEEEDTEVGFPGPEHHIAEQALPMRIAMGILALGAIVAGWIQIPNVTEALDTFLEPTFEGSRFHEELHPSDALTFGGLAIGALCGIGGIAVAFLIWRRRPEIAVTLRERFKPLHTLFVNKWYADEALDRLFVRPAAWVGRFGQQTFERLVVNGLFVGGPVGLVRASSAAVRSRQSGFLRAYAALMVLGLGGVLLWLLIRS